ncbi:MAG: tricorn protease [Planctomycetota bacterium]|jgi:tricorn protease
MNLRSPLPDAAQRWRSIAALGLLGLTAGAASGASSPMAQDAGQAGMLRYPDVSASQIVFVYANDLWLVPREGGTALPLASPPGAERNPRFSHDGQTVAFGGNYDGDSDIYTVSIKGGVPFRVTHHPGGDQLTDWTRDGRLIFSTSAFSGQRRAPRMYTVSSEGGMPEQVSIPYGLNGTIHADGKRLAYTPNARDGRNWKRYVGGTASDVWIFNLENKTSQRVTDWEGTDSFPMWHADDLYYVSDRGPAHRLNVWKFDPASGKHAQITTYTDFDVKWPSIGPGDKGQGEIVFQNDSGLYLIDLGTAETRQVQVKIPGAAETVRARMVDVAGSIRNSGVSATGKRAAVEARGDIWTLPAEKGKARNLTATAGIAERDPSWSPDGRWIAYFSDATGEYEMYIKQSDGRGETKQLTTGTEGFKYAPTWSPNSEKIVFSDRSGTIYLHDIEAGTTESIDQNEGAEWGVPVNWSHDGRWLTYTNLAEDSDRSSVVLYDTTQGEKHRVTSDMFEDSSPVFDRKGDFLYFGSVRDFNGQQGSMIDSNYVYTDGEVLLAVPLRADVEFPWTPKVDEETWDDEEKDEDAEEDDGDDDSDEDAEEEGDEDSEDGDDAPKSPDDGVSGEWSGTLNMPGAGDMDMSLTLSVDGSSLTGTVVVPMGTGDVQGDFDAATGSCSGTISPDFGEEVSFSGSIKDGSLEWSISTPDGVATVTAERTSAATSSSDDDDSDEEGDDQGKKGKKKPVKVVEIDIEGFEHRAIQLPIGPGNFGSLAVNDKGHLMYVRRGEGIKVYDIHGDDQKEKKVTGGGGFELTADGKKMLTGGGSSLSIGKAGEGSTPKGVQKGGMDSWIDPREEWPQVYRDSWRFFRDYFYAANMHGVDWDAVYEQYRPMIDYCTTREDVDYVMRETVAELNVGHAYVRGGPMERGPSVGVGLLGADYAVENGAYRISNIVEGGVWDSDARGPLSMPGVDVHEGDYLLAVDGTPMNMAMDPWAAFVGKGNEVVELTVSALPTMDDTARKVLVKTLTSEGNLRYREWIESNRAMVEEASGGRVGYIYVPDTGQNGRNNLFRQFYGQAHMDALIIDERWNGGGQFPNREIEALNRPRTNYWGRRWGRSMATPGDSHQGPKCMLINRDAGSGGDMFPYLFRQAGIGKLIGTRTWGGLVGYSGSPQLIDGGTLAVPSFGFYELDGSWGVEGHGVDPDIEVLDDPALMQNGADPQIAVAVQQMLQELEEGAYVAPPRPADPDRTGMGLPESER